jgi:hypothetical protein
MTSMAKAIRLKCVDCGGGSAREVTRCSVTDCSLWQFRFGKRPKTVRARQPRLLDGLYVLLAGCIDDFNGDSFARQVLADPRAYSPKLLAGYSDAEIVAVVTQIQATPRTERFGPVSPRIDSGAVEGRLRGTLTT